MELIHKKIHGEYKIIQVINIVSQLNEINSVKKFGPMIIKSIFITHLVFNI